MLRAHHTRENRLLLTLLLADFLLNFFTKNNKTYLKNQLPDIYNTKFLFFRKKYDLFFVFHINLNPLLCSPNHFHNRTKLTHSFIFEKVTMRGLKSFTFNYFFHAACLLSVLLPSRKTISNTITSTTQI